MEAYMLINPKTMCPALILAANRNERVKGRTKILIVSIKISGGLNHLGAPLGRRDALNSFGEFRAEDKINPNHKGAPKDRVITKCEVVLKI